ncbi:MAG: hydroxysqualene dehydroxylase HpnE [Pseudomonadota bacterium]|nr:hydroxysqualene dehydroxylase HpnE [Pseudomonadota bacterium]
MRVAIVGGGWAGLAAAVEATRAGHAVTLFEAARTLGGRARRVLADDGLVLDNGQHILIGAYRATLALMRGLGVDLDAALLRLPLALRFPDGGGLSVPAGLPPPLDLLAGIAGAQGWSLRDKFSLVRTSLRWRARGFRCAPDDSVAALCTGLTPRVMDELVAPLCVSALNVPVERASGEVFLRVLHDALFAERGGADLLLPRVDLGALLPDPAAQWLGAHGASIRIGQRVQSIAPTAAGWTVDGGAFERVLLAAPAWESARLARGASVPPAMAWAEQADALGHEAIATVYLRGTPGLPGAALRALRHGPDTPAQFVFDRGALGGPAGLAALVVSASEGTREEVEAQALAQARAQLGWHGAVPVQTIVEKRATFACTPGVRRPPIDVAPGLSACGDYVEGPYPATLEGAVLSGQAAAAAL